MEADLILICFTALTRVPGAIKFALEKTATSTTTTNTPNPRVLAEIDDWMELGKYVGSKILFKFFLTVFSRGKVPISPGFANMLLFSPVRG